MRQNVQASRRYVHQRKREPRPQRGDPRQAFRLVRAVRCCLQAYLRQVRDTPFQHTADSTETIRNVGEVIRELERRAVA